MASGKNKKHGFLNKLLTLLIAVALIVCGYSVYKVVSTKADLDSQEDLFDDYRSMVKTTDGTSESESAESSQKEDSQEEQEDEPAAVTSSASEGKTSSKTTTDNKSVKKKKSTHDYSEVYEMNSDFVGWVTVKNTNIDYPVVQTPDDPEHYLRLDLNENYATAGTCFVGANCYVDSTSFVIYGHNMDNDTMFGTLDYYKEEDFWKDNQTFEFNTMDEDRTYRIFAAFEISVYDSNFKYFDYVGDLDDEAYAEFIEKCRSYSMYDTGIVPEDGAQILMLSTCSYHTTGGRFVVVAVIEEDED